MNRSYEAEILDADGISEDVVVRAHKDLDRLHGLLGNTAAFLAALKNDPLPVRRILDVGCGHGGLLLQLQRQLGVDVAGVDLRPRGMISSFSGFLGKPTRRRIRCPKPTSPSARIWRTTCPKKDSSR